MRNRETRPTEPAQNERRFAPSALEIFAKDQDFLYDFNWFSPSVAQVESRYCSNSRMVGPGLGTAFMVGPNRALTAWHVVDDNASTQLKFTRVGYSSAAQVIGANKELDLAVLWVENPPQGVLPVNRFLSLPEAQEYASLYKHVEVDDRVALIGHPNGGDLTLAGGEVVEAHGLWFSQPGSQIVSSAFGPPGSSGSPLINSHGQLLGLAHSYRPTSNQSMALYLNEPEPRKLIFEAFDAADPAYNRQPFCVGRVDFWASPLDIADSISIREHSPPAAEISATYYLLVESVNNAALGNAYRAYAQAFKNQLEWADWHKHWATTSIRDFQILSAYRSGHEEMVAVVEYLAETTDDQDEDVCFVRRVRHVLERGIVEGSHRQNHRSSQPRPSFRPFEIAPAWLISEEVSLDGYPLPRECSDGYEGIEEFNRLPNSAVGRVDEPDGSHEVQVFRRTKDS